MAEGTSSNPTSFAEKRSLSRSLSRSASTGPHCQRARNGCKHGAVHDDLLTVKNSKSLPSPGCALVTRRTDYVPAHEGAEVNATASIRIPLPQGCAGPSAPENVVV